MSMTIDEFMTFCREQNEVIKDKYGMTDETILALAHVAKLTEECGELSEKVLGRLNLQRKVKLEETKKNLADEIADVILVVGILAESMDISVEEALKKKIVTLEQRNNEEK